MNAFIAHPCGVSHCFAPHEDFTTFIDDGWAGKVFSPNPRPHSEGHEALMIHRGPKVVTISTEFGEARSAVEIPVETFDFLVKQTIEGAWPS